VVCFSFDRVVLELEDFILQRSGAVTSPGHSVERVAGGIEQGWILLGSGLRCVRASCMPFLFMAVLRVL
jgi:hypothetical protein